MGILKVCSLFARDGNFESAHASVLAQRENESAFGAKRDLVPPCGRGFSNALRVFRSEYDLSGSGAERAPLQRKVHRLDEPIKLSLSLVASPQCRPPFHLTINISADSISDVKKCMIIFHAAGSNARCCCSRRSRAHSSL